MEPSTISRADTDLRHMVRRWLTVVGLGSLVVAAVLLGVSRSPLLQVRDVRVVGTARVAPHRVERLAELSVGEPILWLDHAAIRERILREPWIADVGIEVELPSRVILRVSERSPIAAVELARRPLLLAADGTILGPGRTRGLPLIVLPEGPLRRMGAVPDLRTLTRLLESLDPAVRGEVRRLEVGDGGALGLRLRGGILVRWGTPHEMGAKARALEDVLAWAATQGLRLRVVNVAAPTAPTVIASE